MQDHGVIEGFGTGSICGLERSLSSVANRRKAGGREICHLIGDGG